MFYGFDFQRFFVPSPVERLKLLPEAIRLENEIAFYQAVKAVLVKGLERKGRPEDEPELAVRKIVSTSLVSEEVIDVFAVAGSRRTRARTW